jgi:hypothetical protein
MEENIVAPSPTDQPRGAVCYFGIYRSDHHGVVNAADAGQMNAIIRNAFRKSFNGRGVGEGLLKNLVGKHSKDPERWQIALERLVNYQLIVLEINGARDSLVIKPTDMGRDYARELIGRQGRGVDHGTTFNN